MSVQRCVIVSFFAVAVPMVGVAAATDTIQLVVRCLYTPGCVGEDLNGDELVSVADVVAAVRGALPPGAESPTVTPSATATARTSATAAGPSTTPTRSTASTPVVPTATPSVTASPGKGSIAGAAAGASVFMAQAARGLPDAFSAFAQLMARTRTPMPTATAMPAAMSAALRNGAGTDTCIVGGCEIKAGPPRREYTLTFNQCMLATSRGSTLTISDGTIAAVADAGLCDIPPTSLTAITFDDVQLMVQDAHGMTTLTATFNLTGSAMATVDGSSACELSSIHMRLSGTALIVSPTLTVTLSFSDTHVVLDMLQFDASCVLEAYEMTIDGAIGFSSPVGGTFDGDFANFHLSADSSNDPAIVGLDGDLSSPCFGTNLTFTTIEPMTLAEADACPGFGTVTIGYGGTIDTVSFDSGAVSIEGSVNQTYESCLARDLYVCPVPTGPSPTPTVTASPSGTPTRTATRTPRRI